MLKAVYCLQFAVINRSLLEMLQITVSLAIPFFPENLNRSTIYSILSKVYTDEDVIK